MQEENNSTETEETPAAKAYQDVANEAPEVSADEQTQEDDAKGPTVETLQAENAELKDRLLRTMAEMENLRRRTEKEVRDAKSYSVASFARDMLVINDNLERAIEAVPEDQRADELTGMKSLVEGVEMVEREMHNQLEKHGVKRLSPEGEKFDPHFHQAMFEVPNTEVPNNTVVQVVQAGYVIADRVLRPAMVGVSKGGPKVMATDAKGAPGDNLDKQA
ncbi:nucleotide exchange factor GrpE [Polycladidibacter stylochi]|uniref:nucleotide exchange factor GrpE n=1 Tax=Polycladidibacter stylochi TaxID=1807766 RepID=UPI000A709261